MQERGLTQGTVWMCGRMMGGLTPLLWMLLVAASVARILAPPAVLPPSLPSCCLAGVFWLFGLVGVVWVTVFALWFRNRPEENPRVNAAELAWIRSGGRGPGRGHAGVPWGRILRSRNLWLLCLMYGCQSYGWYFYITYLPQFGELVEAALRPAGRHVLGALVQGRPAVDGRRRLPRRRTC